MKKYNKFNFFKHTYCEFIEVSSDIFKENPVHFKSKSDSQYYYTHEGVYRYSDHWGRVANCRWKLIADKSFKNQQMHLGYAKWTDFYHLNDTDKLFYIEVDYQNKKVNFKYETNTEQTNHFLYTALEAQKRVKHIRSLLTEDKWAKHFDADIEELRYNIITVYSTSNEQLTKIKQGFKK